MGDEVIINEHCHYCLPRGGCLNNNFKNEHLDKIGKIIKIDSSSLPIFVKYFTDETNVTQYFWHSPNCLNIREKGFDAKSLINSVFGGNNGS